MQAEEVYERKSWRKAILWRPKTDIVEHQVKADIHRVGVAEEDAEDAGEDSGDLLVLLNINWYR